jgi:transposase-like protein
MGQVLHGCATTTTAIRRAIRHSQESLRILARRNGINQKTVAKWKKRASFIDLPTGPKDAKSTVLSIEDEAVVVAFRRHTLLPLDDCLYALQATIPHLTRSSLHRCLQRHGISRLPDVEGDKPGKRRFKAYPIGYFHIDIAEVHTAEGRLYLFAAIDRTSKFAFTELHVKAATRVAADFLHALIEAVPSKVHTVLTDNGTHFTDTKGESWSAAEIRTDDRAQGTVPGACFRIRLRSHRRRSSPHQAQASMDKRPGRAHEPHDQRRHRQTFLLRRPRPAPTPLGRLRLGLQLRQAAQDPQRSQSLPVHLQGLDKGTAAIQP